MMSMTDSEKPAEGYVPYMPWLKEAAEKVKRARRDSVEIRDGLSPTIAEALLDFFHCFEASSILNRGDALNEILSTGTARPPSKNVSPARVVAELREEVACLRRIVVDAAEQLARAERRTPSAEEHEQLQEELRLAQDLTRHYKNDALRMIEAAKVWKDKYDALKFEHDASKIGHENLLVAYDNLVQRHEGPSDE
jgi:hypothetical protein